MGSQNNGGNNILLTMENLDIDDFRKHSMLREMKRNIISDLLPEIK